MTAPGPLGTAALTLATWAALLALSFPLRGWRVRHPRPLPALAEPPEPAVRDSVPYESAGVLTGSEGGAWTGPEGNPQ